MATVASRNPTSPCMWPPALCRVVIDISQRRDPAHLGKLCTGGRAGADGWLNHESGLGEAGIDLVIAGCETRDAVPLPPVGLTGRTSPVVAAAGGGPGRGWPARRG